MKPDDLTWLSTELGFPVLQEAEGRVLANAPALVALGGVPPVSLDDAARQLAGQACDPSTVRDAIDRARAGQRVSLLLCADTEEAQRMLAWSGPDGLRVTFAPAQSERIHETQRRASLVDVAAAVSHEVANAMGAIGGWADLATRGDGASIEPFEALRLIASCSRTAEQAARRMLSLARGAEDELAVTDLSDLSQEVVSLLSLSARQARVQLTSSIEPELMVRASRPQLFTVLWNLAKNAIEACEPTESVHLAVEGDETHAIVVVRDTGHGLLPSAKEKLFLPYFSTKTAGTGIGLSLVRSEVEKLQGKIEVDSTLGMGTTFRVTLPRLSRASAMRTSPPVEPTRVQSDKAPAGGHVLDARILVVDDDDALREMVATALSLKGAHVTTARSAAEARQLAGPFDIALIDMMLDDCRGDELLASLRKQGSVHAAMLVTGTVQRPRLVPGGEPDDWVRKPFELSQLVERLRRTLERHEMLSAATATVRV